jgi:hypothetical protein
MNGRHSAGARFAVAVAAGYDRAMPASRRLLPVLLLATWTAVAHADSELERLRAENATLRARVDQLEAENGRLRGEAKAAANAAPADASLAGVLASRAEEQVRTVPDPRGGTAVVTDQSRLDITAGGQSRHWITFRSQSAGGSGDPAELVIASSASGIAYRDVSSIALVIDGTAVEVPVIRYQSDPISNARSGAIVGRRETVAGGLSLATLDRLAVARQVEGTLGQTRFRLTPEQLAAARAFRKRLAT